MLMLLFCALIVLFPVFVWVLCPGQIVAQLKPVSSVSAVPIGLFPGNLAPLVSSENSVLV